MAWETRLLLEVDKALERAFQSESFRGSRYRDMRLKIFSL